MLDLKKRSQGILALGWGIIISNILLIIFHFLPETFSQNYEPSKLVALIANVAAFPIDLYHSFLRELWLAQLTWILVMIVCGIGILLLNRFARDVFIVLNIIHITILASWVIFRFGQSYQAFLDYFFKLYFNLVASGTYVTFLTFPEVREQFRLDLEQIKIHWWFLRSSIQKTAPKDPKSYYNLGLAYSRMNRQEEAISALEKAVALNPKDENVQYYLGMARFQQKHYSAAITALQDTVRLNPLHVKAYYQMGMIFEIQGCFKEAVTSFEQASNVQPENAELASKLGDIYAAVGRWEEALKVFEKISAGNPANEYPYYQTGKILLSFTQKEKEAEEAFKKALRLNPKRFETLFSLGVLAIKANRHKDAVRYFKDALRLDENHLQAHYQLGFAYAMLGDFDSARRECRYLKERDPDLAHNLSLLLK